MTKPKLDITKPCQTRSGLEVRLLGKLEGSKYPFVWAKKNEGSESVISSTEDGSNLLGMKSCLDVINVPAKPVITEKWHRIFTYGRNHSAGGTVDLGFAHSKKPDVEYAHPYVGFLVETFEDGEYVSSRVEPK